MGTHLIHNVIQDDYLSSNVKIIRYDLDHGTDILYIDANKKVQSKTIDLSKGQAGNLQVPMIECDDWYRNWYGLQSDTHKECAARLLCAAIEASPHRLEAENVQKAIYKADMQLQLKHDLSPHESFGHILYPGKTLLHAKLADKHREEIEKTASDRKKAYSYECERRIIPLENMPENSVCITPTNEIIGRSPIRKDGAEDPTAFGMFVMPDYFYLVKLSD